MPTGPAARPVPPTRRFRPVLLLLLVAASACGPQDDAPPEPESPRAVETPASRPPARPAPRDTFALAADAVRSARPVAPVRVEGACPFECCQYGRWTTTAPTRLFARAGDTTRVVATLPAGTAMDVPTGFVLLTRLGRVVVPEPAVLYRSFEETVPVAGGDTVVVLQSVGEGAFRVWYGGELLEAEGRMLQAAGPGAVPEAQWWARARLADGRAGWLWMDRTPPVQGADACAGPPG